MSRILAFAAFSVLLLGSEAGVSSERQTDAKGPPPFPSPPSNTTLGNYSSAAVVSDVPICSQIGRDILLSGGNAVDAAVATLFCVGVVNPQNSGIGGGSFMTIAGKGEDGIFVNCINGREAAPLAATENMFGNNPSLAAEGPLSIAVPGELAASYAAWKAYGKLDWKDLVMPAATLAKKGVRVTKALAAMLRAYRKNVMENPSLSFFINPTTRNVLQEGDFFIIPGLGATLRVIAKDGADTFYNGEIADFLMSDLQDMGSIITLEDLQKYRAKFVRPIIKEIGEFFLISHPPPASGAVTAFILNVLKSKLGKNGSALNKNPLTYHWIVEAFKHGFGQRTNSGDPDFVPSVKNLVNNLTSDAFAASILAKIQDGKTFTNPSYYGDTSKRSSSTRMADDDDEVRQNPLPYGYSWDTHVSVIDGNGMAVSVTSGINIAFASRNVSASTGIFLNSCMGDFSAPRFPNPVRPTNFIKPGKRPQSSKTPTILLDGSTGLPIMAVGGGAGGPEMITAVVQTIIRDMWFGENIKQSIDDLRLHHSLNPMTLKAEPNYPSAILSDLKNKGHTITTGFYETHTHGVSPGKNGFMYANADYRNGGDAAGF